MKQISIKTRIIVFACLLTITGIFISGYIFGHRKANRVATVNIEALGKEISRYEIELNNRKYYITSVEQELKSLSQAKSDGDVANAELRKINLKQVQEISLLKLKIDTLINIPHSGKVDTVIIEGKPQNVLYLPFSFEKKDEWMNIAGNIDRKGLLSISARLMADIKLITGTDKKTGVVTATVLANNPYLTINSINSVKLDKQKPKKYGIGVFGGYGMSLNPLKMSPVIGVGVTYSLLSF
jgi:hypothetical protein